MNSIADRLSTLRNDLPADCTLVAVSKTKPSEAIMEAYDAGHRDFGENKVQELVGKAEELPKDIRWHMIGHLQRNKVKYIAPFVHLIHSVDSLKLLNEINKQGLKVGRVIDVLLQVHIADEETKFGFDEEEIADLLKSEEFNSLSNIKVKGLMGMATNTSDTDKVLSEFQGLNSFFKSHKDSNHQLIEMDTLSMGMSGDYQIAIRAGSNMVRVGSVIFGPRNY